MSTSNLLLASKNVILEEEPAVRQIAGVATAVPAFLGVTERGPFGATLVTADTYKKVFGGYVASALLMAALDGFFQNGGQSAYVARVVHHTDPADPTTKTSAKATKTLSTDAIAATSGVTQGAAGPYDMEPGQTLVVSMDGGGDQTFTFAAVAAQRDSSGVWPKAISDGQTLTVAIDGGSVQTIAFLTAEFVSIGAATAAEVAAVIAAKIVGAQVSVVGGQVRIKSDKRGTGSSVNVTGGSANGVLGYTTGATSGTGDVANIDAVTAAEVVAKLSTLTGGTAAVSGGKPTITSGTTGGSSTAQVKNTSTATAIGFDNAVHTGLASGTLSTLRVDGKTDGAYANALSVVIEASSSGDADRFNLRVVRSGVTIETWNDLSMTDTDSRYCETIVNNADTGSDYIALVDLDAATTSPNDRPANGTFTPTGGSDGLSSLGDNDFIGGSGANGKVGIRCFDVVQDATLLASPDRATAAVHNAMLVYCETTRQKSMFAVLDPPESTSASGMVTYVDTTAAIRELSEFGAIYWPRVKVSNPSKSVYGTADQIVVPPSGHICGLMARNDAKRDGGVYDAPAGVENGVLYNVLGFETDTVLDESVRDLIYPKRINPITTQPGRSRYVDGSYTLKSTGNFPTVSERRGVIFLEQSIKAFLELYRHRNNDELLRAEVKRIVDLFLTGETKKRAFRTTDPARAFWTDWGPGLNPVAVQRAGKLVGRVGLATNSPVQWAITSFTQDTRSLTE